MTWKWLLVMALTLLVSSTLGTSLPKLEEENVLTLSIARTKLPRAFLILPPHTGAHDNPAEVMFTRLSGALAGEVDFAIVHSSRTSKTILRVTTGEGRFVDVDADGLSFRRALDAVLGVALARTHEVAKVEDIAPFAEGDGLVLGLFRSQEQRDSCQSWGAAELTVRSKVDTATHVGDELPAALGLALESLPAVLYFRPDGGTEMMLAPRTCDPPVHDGDWLKHKNQHSHSLAEWMKESVRARPEPLTRESFQKAAMFDTWAAVLFHSADEQVARAELAEFEALSSSERLYDDATFFHANATALKDFADLFGLKAFPAVVLTRDLMKFYTAGSVGEVEALIGRIKRGEVEPSVPVPAAPPKPKSAAPPANNDELPVRVVTRDTFVRDVLEADADVFIEFYYPWCGHCKQLAPFWEALGMSFSRARKNVIIAKYDMVANDMPDGVTVPGAPTMLFYRKDRKNKPEAYTGPRDLASLIAHVHESVSSPIILPKDPVEGWDGLSQSLQELVVVQRKKIAGAMASAVTRRNAQMGIREPATNSERLKEL